MKLIRYELGRTSRDYCWQRFHAHKDIYEYDQCVGVTDLYYFIQFGPRVECPIDHKLREFI